MLKDLAAVLVALAVLLTTVGAGAAEPSGPTGSLEPLLAELRRDRLFSEAEVGIAVVRLATGEVVFSEEPSRALVPASTMKVVTAAAALHHRLPELIITCRKLRDPMNQKTKCNTLC